jgi:hypothetical protein
MLNGSKATCKTCGLSLLTIATVREIGTPNLVRFVQCFRCGRRDAINLPLLPMASDAPLLRPVI